MHFFTTSESTDALADGCFGEANNSIDMISINGYLGLIIRTNDMNEKELWVYTRNTGTETTVWGYGNLSEHLYNVTDEVSKIFNIENVVDIYVSCAEANINSSAAYILMNDGKVYMWGSNEYSGQGITSGYVNGLTCLSDIGEFPQDVSEIIYTEAEMNATSPGTVLFKTVNGEYYTTGNSVILFREAVYQKSWIKIASNVKSFKANTTTTGSNCLAYIDNNDDIWVCGESSKVLGMNTDDEEIIYSFVRLKDYLVGLNIYNSIDQKVEDYNFVGNTFYIKTNSLDNNTLYCSCVAEGVWMYHYSGLGEGVSANIPTYLFENVKSFFIGRTAQIFVVLLDGSVYSWGYYTSLGQAGSTASYTPVLQTKLASFDALSLQGIFISSGNAGIIDSDGALYVYGSATGEISGALTTSSNLTLVSQELQFIDLACGGDSTCYLTDSGQVFACGRERTIGIGSIATSFLSGLNDTGLSDVISIVGGNGFFIATKSDGTVWATGDNSNGILGRWVGVGRGESNSRYKTAFNWVECTELEI